jgi:hypothetical protein
MRRVLLYISLVLLLTSGKSLAVEVAGIKVPETVRLESTDTELVLNGAGVHKKTFVKVYVGALYLPKRLNDVESILDEPGAKRIMMKFLYTKVSANKIIDNLNKGLSENNTSEELGFFQAILIKFKALFRDVYKGDMIRLDYLPEEGTQVWLNNKLICTVKGVEFYRALLKVWLGPKSSDEVLKEAMLGASV